MPPINDAGIKLVSNDSKDKASGCEDIWFSVFVGVCVDFSLSKADFSASRSFVEV